MVHTWGWIEIRCRSPHFAPPLSPPTDDDDLRDEDQVDDIDPLMDSLSPDDLLTPLERVEKYFQSEDMGERDLANRIVPEALQTVDNLGQFELLLEIAFALANDHG